MRVFSWVLVFEAFALLVMAAWDAKVRHDYRAANQGTVAAVVVAVLAAVAHLAGSWQQFLCSLMLITAAALMVAGMVLMAVGPDMRSDLFAEWRAHRAAGRLDRAAAGRGLRIETVVQGGDEFEAQLAARLHRAAASIDPDHPPTGAGTG